MDKDKKRKDRAICLDNWEKQIIYGALLGNGFIVDPPKGLHCYLVMRQSKKQDVTSLKYKAEELKAFARQSSLYTDAHDYRWTSISHPDFDLIRSFCYKDKEKHVTMDWLNTLRDVSLMVWWLDKGFWSDGNVALNTTNLKKGNNLKVVAQYFNEVGMPCKLENTKLYFDEEGSRQFLRVIGHRVPPVLHHRLEAKG